MKDITDLHQRFGSQGLASLFAEAVDPVGERSTTTLNGSRGIEVSAPALNQDGAVRVASINQAPDGCQASPTPSQRPQIILPGNGVSITECAQALFP